MKNNFNEWLKNRLKEDSRINRRRLLAGAGAFASSALLSNFANAANTPAGSPGLSPPEDSVGMIPQVRYWEIFDKNGHMENFDKSWVYIRFTDTPDILSRIPRNSLSEKDKEYVSSHENMVLKRQKPHKQNNVNKAKDVDVAQENKEFNPKFGPQPPGVKNPKPIQVWKHQFKLIQDSESKMRRGIKPSVEYVILYRYYNGQMPDPPFEESFSEAKDACYHKVKSRYRIWPSAYASGSLVRCRKVGAKNWGDSKKKKKMISEALKNKKDYDDAAQAAMFLHYNGKNAADMSSHEIMKELHKLNKTPPQGVSDILFAARVRSVAKETIKSDDFVESTFKLEKERGLKGWFDRNNGKGWIDCKASKKGNLVPCGRKATGKSAERSYPACRPTLSACNKKGTRRKKSSKRVSWE